jgi:hypothetical protein
MLAVDRLYPNKEKLIAQADTLRRQLDDALTDEKFYELIVARANTADAIKKRLTRTEELFEAVL